MRDGMEIIVKELRRKQGCEAPAIKYISQSPPLEFGNTVIIFQYQDIKIACSVLLCFLSPALSSYLSLSLPSHLQQSLAITSIHYFTPCKPLQAYFSYRVSCNITLSNRLCLSLSPRSCPRARRRDDASIGRICSVGV